MVYRAMLQLRVRHAALVAGILLACGTAVLAARIPGGLPGLTSVDSNLEAASSVDLDEEADDLTFKEAMLLASEEPVGPDDSGKKNFCHKNSYRKRTMKVIKETPFIGVFPDLQGQRRFEASGITFAKGAYWVVFDNLQALGKIDLQFKFRGPENALVGPTSTESQFEGLSYIDSTDTFLAIRESFEHEEHGLVPLTLEMRVDAPEKPGDPSTYRILAVCAVHFVLQDGNKGFESLHFYEEPNGNGGYDKYILGLCESNFCATILGPDPPGLQRGNGRVVWAKYRPAAEKGDECSWKVLKVIEIPESAYFLDYSAFAFDSRKGSSVAITSQEDAAVWVGEFDWKAMEFVSEGAEVYHFPRDEDCAKIYCNVEGVAWLDASRLVLTSDRSKRIQDHRCMEKDQSVHVMALP